MCHLHSGVGSQEPLIRKSAASESTGKAVYSLPQKEFLFDYHWSCMSFPGVLENCDLLATVGSISVFSMLPCSLLFASFDGAS